MYGIKYPANAPSRLWWQALLFSWNYRWLFDKDLAVSHLEHTLELGLELRKYFWFIRIHQRFHKPQRNKSNGVKSHDLGDQLTYEFREMIWWWFVVAGGAVLLKPHVIQVHTIQLRQQELRYHKFREVCERSQRNFLHFCNEFWQWWHILLLCNVPFLLIVTILGDRCQISEMPHTRKKYTKFR